MQLSPEALEQVISKEVEEVTEEDLDKLIAHFRAERQNFLANEASGKRASTSKPKTAAKNAELASLISDLDLGI